MCVAYYILAVCAMWVYKASNTNSSQSAFLPLLGLGKKSKDWMRLKTLTHHKKEQAQERSDFGGTD